MPAAMHRALEKPWVRVALVVAIVFDVAMLTFNFAADRYLSGNADDRVAICAAWQRRFPDQHVVKVEADMIERLRAIRSDRMKVRVAIAPATPQASGGYQLWQAVVEKRGEEWVIAGPLILIKASDEGSPQ